MIVTRPLWKKAEDLGLFGGSLVGAFPRYVKWGQLDQARFCQTLDFLAV